MADTAHHRHIFSGFLFLGVLAWFRWGLIGYRYLSYTALYQYYRGTATTVRTRTKRDFAGSRSEKRFTAVEQDSSTPHTRASGLICWLGTKQKTISSYRSMLTNNSEPCLSHVVSLAVAYVCRLSRTELCAPCHVWLCCALQREFCSPRLSLWAVSGSFWHGGRARHLTGSTHLSM